MRILHVVADLDTAKGGPVTAVMGLARAQSAAGEQVAVVATDRGRAAPADGLDIRLFPSPDPIWRFSPAMARRMGLHVAGSDVVHLHGLWDFPILAAARACRRVDKPYLMTLHGMLNARSLSSHALRKRVYLRLAGEGILRHAARLHFTSETERASAAALGHGTKAFVCPFATEPWAADADGAAFRARLGLGAEQRIVLCVGRLHPQKQPHILIDAFETISRQDAEACLAFVGGGEEDFVRSLRRRASSLGSASGRVFFTGPLERSELAEAYAACELLVQPSNEESLGLAVLEAMAAGKPVVVTPGVGVAEDAERGNAAIVAPPDAAAIAAAVTRLLSEPALRSRMGCDARRLVEEKYSWPGVVRALGGQYRAVARPAGESA